MQAAAPPEPEAKSNSTGSGDSSDWYTLVNGIITGASYHASLVALAARLVGSRMHDGTAVKLLRAIMSASTAPHDAVRWQARFDAIPRIVSSAREKYQQDDAPPVGPLPFIDMQPWDSTPAPSRPWAVTDRIPINQPTLFSGEGAAGKTLVELQLCVAHVTGRDWLGGLPEPGPAIYYGAEDDSDELHRRLTAIAEHYGVKFSDLIAGGLHLLSFAGADAVLAIPDRQGKVQPTPLFDRLLEAAGDIRPRHIGIDATADTFAGNEIDRSQVRQFVGLMRKLAIAANGSVVLLAHPSLTGISSGTGLSGSTAWHNSVRARMLLKAPSRDSNDEQSASDLRELSFLKNNYGPLAETHRPAVPQRPVFAGGRPVHARKARARPEGRRDLPRRSRQADQAEPAGQPVGPSPSNYAAEGHRRPSRRQGLYAARLPGRARAAAGGQPHPYRQLRAALENNPAPGARTGRLGGGVMGLPGYLPGCFLVLLGWGVRCSRSYREGGHRTPSL